jgi:hypothetical protein
MPFGEIFTGAIRLIWRNRKLLLFPLIGLTPLALGMAIYQLSIGQWMGAYFQWLNRFMLNPDAAPERMFSDLFGNIGLVAAGYAVFLLLALVSLVISLFTTSGVILEASRAYDGEPVDVGRGLREGAGRAGHLFLVQLLWSLPALLLGAAWIVGVFALAAGAGATAGSSEDAGGALGAVWLLCCCGSTCLGLFYALAAGIFSPMMQQSAVAGRRSVGQAVREGWALTRQHLGPMVVFWLLSIVAVFVVTIAIQTLSTIISLPLTGAWIFGFGRMIEDAQSGDLPQIPQISGPLLILSSLLSLVVSMAGYLLLGAFTPAFWNGVYRHFTRPVVAPMVEHGDEEVLEHGSAENN